MLFHHAAARIAEVYGSDRAVITSGMVFPGALSTSMIVDTTGKLILLVEQKAAERTYPIEKTRQLPDGGCLVFI